MNLLKKVDFGIILFIILFHFSVNGGCVNSKSDSVFVADSVAFAELFNRLYIPQANKDSILERINSIRKKNNSEKLEQLYALNYTKWLFRTGKLDEALDFINKQLNALKDSTSEYSANLYNLKAAVYSYKNDYPKAVSYFKKAIEINEKNGNDYRAAIIKNNLANIFISLSDYQKAYEYSKQSYQVLKKRNDTLYLPQIASVVAISLVNLDNNQKAKPYIDTALFLSEKYKNPVGLIISNYALGEYYCKEKKCEQAEEIFETSLKLSEKYNYTQYILLNNVALLRLNHELQHFEKAIEYGLNALKYSEMTNNQNIRYSIFKHLAYAYAGLKKYDEAYQYLNKAHDTYIAASNAEKKKFIDELITKYETEKIKKENVENRLKISETNLMLQKRQIQLIILSVALLIIILLVLFYIRQNKQKMALVTLEKEKEKLQAEAQAEEKEKERISELLHNSVASSLTFLKFQIENMQKNKNYQDLENIIPAIENTHTAVRQISHNLMPFVLSNKTLPEAIEAFCQENSTPELQIEFYNSLNELQLKDDVSSFLYRLVQEFVNNTIKHARASVCTIQLFFDEKAKIINLTIEDDGIGMNKEDIQNTGLYTTILRAKKMDIDINIETEPNKGVLILIQYQLR
jgi:signal transduction histidine kinase